MPYTASFQTFLRLLMNIGIIQRKVKLQKWTAIRSLLQPVWFLAAVSLLTKFLEIFRKIFPKTCNCTLWWRVGDTLHLPQLSKFITSYTFVRIKDFHLQLGFNTFSAFSHRSTVVGTHAKSSIERLTVNKKQLSLKEVVHFSVRLRVKQSRMELFA